MDMRPTRAASGPLVIGLALLVAVAAFLLLHRGHGAVDPKGISPPMAGMAKRFGVLSGADSNQCGLGMDDVMRMPPGMRLQGACCRAMDFRHYVRQVRGLRRYASLGLVPSDPYDVPVSLAHRLLRFDRGIRLSPSEARTYSHAVQLSHEHGPCCCECWRWNTFEGQAKALITHQGIGAAEIAHIWNLEDGCGGA